MKGNPTLRMPEFLQGWRDNLRRGLGRTSADDPLAAGRGGLTRVAFKNLLPLFRQYRRKMAGGILLVTVTSLLALPQPMITRYLVDHVILERHLGMLAAVVLLIAALAAAEKISGLLQQYYFTHLEQDVLLRIQQDLFAHTLRLPKAFFDGEESGYLVSRLSSDVQGMRWFFSTTVVHVLANVFRFFGGICFLIYLEWRLAIGVLLFIPAIAMLAGWFSARMRFLSHRNMEAQGRLTGRFQEFISSVPLLKAFSSESRVLSSLTEKMREAFRTSLEQSTVGAAAGLLMTAVPGVARLGVLAFGAYWVIDGRWSLGSLLAFQLYLGYVFGPAQVLATANLQLQNARASLERISALLNIPPEEGTTGKEVERLEGEVTFETVGFSYPGRRPVLRDVSFHVRPGEHVVVAGSSGVGKTTLFSLLMLLYPPTSGRILFDGLPAGAYDFRSLRRRIGYVSQDIFLLSGTVRDNIVLGRPGASEGQVMEAAKTARIHDFVNSLPHGYRTEIGEKGIMLSEGQKQRLSIARALVIDPDILVLDEPTSALDSETEAFVLHSLVDLFQAKTLFIAAHRPAANFSADRLFSIDEQGFLTEEAGDVLMGVHAMKHPFEKGRL